MSQIEEHDPELATEFKTILAEHLDVRFKDFRVETERRMKELSARAPSVLTGNGGGPAPQPLLGGDQAFRGWLKAGRGRSSKFQANFSDFHIEQKAATTILSPTVALPTNLPGITGPPELSLRLTELLPVVTLTTGGGVEYAKESSFVPGAAIQVEGELKGTTEIAFTPTLATVRTVATYLKSSLQSLADQPALGQWLDSRLRFSVQLRAEQYLLSDATDGLLAAAGAVTPEFAPAAGGNSLDAIGSAIGQLAASGFTPDGVVMSGSDAAKMRLLKNDVGDYLWVTPNSSLGTASVWSLPLVISPSMAAGTFLVGAFQQAAILFSRQLLVVEVSYENEDDFIRNLCTMRCEERIGLAVPTPGGLLKGTLPTPEVARAGAVKGK